MVWQPSLFLLSIGGLASLQPATLRLIDQGQARGLLTLSSTRASSVAGTFRPSTLAALRLPTSWGEFAKCLPPDSPLGISCERFEHRGHTVRGDEIARPVILRKRRICEMRPSTQIVPSDCRSHHPKPSGEGDSPLRDSHTHRF